MAVAGLASPADRGGIAGAGGTAAGNTCHAVHGSPARKRRGGEGRQARHQDKRAEALFLRREQHRPGFRIAVGRQGRKWTGVTSISRMVKNPSWAPPSVIRRDNPKLPAIIGPGPNNPLGVAVLVLGDGTYGIHGTNRDETIGTDASYGCFRMHNADILALFDKVTIGTTVTVVP
ncbi:MAG: L,D-transpeptidase [Rhizobiales bacterium]|nr:L,D-transpeptidase [Hyphomicrobiales bacterium]